MNYEPYSFATFAGFPPGSANGTGPGAQFNEPSGVAVDTSGNVYVADAGNNTVRKITTAGVVSTLAGSVGVSGSADGQGSAAQFNFPQAVAVDTSGNVYVADAGNNTIRKIDSAGNVTTFAGSAGVIGSADGQGSAAQFSDPQGVAVDSSGNIYVADYDNNTIRKIDSAGNVSTLAGSAAYPPNEADGTGSAARFSGPNGLALDTNGNIYVADFGLSHTIRKVTPAGVVTTIAGSAGVSGSTDGTGSVARFSFPASVAVDAGGNIYVADSGNSTIRKIDSAGNVTTFAGSAGVTGSADGQGSAAQFNNPLGVAVDSSGNVFVGDTNNNTIRRIDSARNVTTLAGSAAGSGSADGTGSAARFNFPTGAAVDTSGNLYVADSTNNTIRKITTPAAVVTTFAGSAGVSGSADGQGSAAQFNLAPGVAVDTNGNVYVADSGNNTIRKIDSAGNVTTFAGSAGVSGSVDGQGSDAQFNNPKSVAVDTNGNVYVTDSGNNTIRRIDSARNVTTLAGSAGVTGRADGTGPAAQFNFPRGVAVDSAGNVYVADQRNQSIRKITSAGVVTTFAGQTSGVFGGHVDGTGTAARFRQPRGVAVDSAGNLYVADSFSNAVRKITPSQVVTTLAGSTVDSSGSADGTGSTAAFDQPFAVAVDSSGNVYVADAVNNTIRIGNPIRPPIATPVGSPVPVNAGQVGIASVSLTFPEITMAGTTTVTLINPTSAGSLPGGYALPGAGVAYEISTTATYPTPVPIPPGIVIAFQVPNVDAATFSQLRVLHNENGTLVDATCPSPRPGPTPDPVTHTIYASVSSLSPFVLAKRFFNATIQQPINADGTSVFSVRRGVVPVKFTLTQNGTSTCTLPPATIAVTRTAGGTIGAINESVYSGATDTGSNFRINSCQYIYNLSASALGVGTYHVDIKIGGIVVGSAPFALK